MMLRRSWWTMGPGCAKPASLGTTPPELCSRPLSADPVTRSVLPICPKQTTTDRQLRNENGRVNGLENWLTTVISYYGMGKESKEFDNVALES